MIHDPLERSTRLVQHEQVRTRKDPPSKRFFFLLLGQQLICIQLCLKLIGKFALEHVSLCIKRQDISYNRIQTIGDDAQSVLCVHRLHSNPNDSIEAKTRTTPDAWTTNSFSDSYRYSKSPTEVARCR